MVVSSTAEMGKPGTLFLGLQLLSYCIGLTRAEQSQYWVAPSGEECDTTKNCTTLEEYARTGAFSWSNVVWIFEEGKHTLNGTIVVFSKVHNVTLTGSSSCKQSVSKCTIHCEGKQACMFLFVASSNITIRNLHFIHQDALDLDPVNATTLQQYLPNKEPLCYNHTLGFPSSMTYAHFNNCLHHRSWVFVDVVHVTVNKVNFGGRNSYWAVVRPNGNYSIMKCKFYYLSLAQSSVSGDPQHYLTVVLRKPHTNVSALTFLIANSRFSSSTYMPTESLLNKWKNESKGTTNELEVIAYPVVHIISGEPLNGWKANITVHKGHFRKCSPFQLTAVEDPGLTVTLQELDARTYFQKWWENHTNLFLGSAIQIFVTNWHTPKMEQIHTSHWSQYQCVLNNSTQLSNITVVLSQMSGYTSDEGCIILFEGRIAASCPKGLRIVLQNNTFYNSSSQRFRSAVHVHQSVVDDHTPQRQTKHDEYRLVIDSNTITNNFQMNRLDRSCIVFERLPEGNPQFLIRPGSQTYTNTCQENCILQGVYLISGFWHHSRVLFTGNTVNRNNAQGLTLVGSVLELEGTNHIHHNQDHYGGGIAMHDNSQLWIRNGSTLNVSDNHAFVRGGGIFISDYCTTTVHSGKCPCFFEFIGSDGQPLRNTSIDTFNASVTLHENSVRIANSARATMIFNPNIDHCTLHGSFEDSTKNKLFQRVFGIPEKPTQDEISSIGRHICNCSDNDGGVASNCTAWGELVVYPGQTLTLSVKLIGDMGISLENVMYIQLETSRFANDTKVYVPLLLHSTHVLNHGCNRLTIPPFPSKDDHNWVLQLMVPLFPDRNHNIFLFEYIETRTLDCPIAYHLVETNHLTSCTCYELLQENVKCLLEIQQFTLPKHYWIGTEEEQEENLTAKVLLSNNCPQIYCATATEEINVSLSKPDKQCKHGRIGVLCGQCPKGKSVVYNSYTCKDCSNWSILLLIPLLIAGPVLIALICCLNLTISVGTINGFLFYLNIISINADVLTIGTGDRTPGRRALELVPFAEICFYNGMDEFASTLLTYLFPVYLLTLVGLICLLPKCKWVNMHKINRRIGPRITPVLSTVILLSYTQLTESVVHSLLFVEVYITNSNTTTSRLVWMFDGSLEYFHSPKHIVLACLALLVLMCFLLPVTVIAIFGDLFRRFSRGPWYMNFLDSFHGAFRFRFGFWIGIRILLRILFIVLKIFLPVDTLFLVIVYTIMTLLFLQILIRPFRGIKVGECVSKKIKEKHFSEPLQRELIHSIDHSFLIHLIAVLIAHDVQNVTTVLIISRVIAYMEFAGILVYHMMEYSPVGPFVFDTWFKLQRKYRRWKESRREATLARPRDNEDGRRPFEEQFDLVLRASDCTDSDYEDESESDDDTVKEIGGKKVADERDDRSSSTDVPLKSHLMTTPLLKKNQGNSE